MKKEIELRLKIVKLSEKEFTDNTFTEKLNAF